MNKKNRNEKMIEKERIDERETILRDNDPITLCSYEKEMQLYRRRPF